MRGSQRSQLLNLQLLSFGCHSHTAQVQKCSPGRRAGWPRLQGFPSLSAPILGHVPFSKPFTPAGSRLLCQRVGGGGTGPSCPTSCPCGWECRAWLGQRCLFQVSRAGWLASAVFVLARRLACRSQGEDELGTMCLFPPRRQVSPESGHPSGAGGRDQRRLLPKGLLWFEGVGDTAPLRTLARLPWWQSLAGGHSAVVAGGAQCSQLMGGMQLMGCGSSGTGVNVCVPAWGCG